MTGKNKLALLVLLKKLRRFMNSRQWSELMARDVREKIDQGGAANESDLVETFCVWVNQILADEHKYVLGEITQLAVQERDAEKRTSYLKMAKLVQQRIPTTTY
jgi:hypothetical protein